MPDADVLRTELAVQDQVVYEQICEGVDSDEEIAFRLLKSLVQHIHLAGMGPFQMLEQGVLILEQLPKEPLLKLQFDRSAIRDDLESAAREISLQANAPQQAIELALEVCKEELGQQRRVGTVNDVQEKELVARYLRKLYESKFESRILAQIEHPQNADPDIVRERLENIGSCSYMEKGLRSFARQIVGRRSTTRLRRPSRSKSSWNLDELLNMDHAL